MKFYFAPMEGITDYVYRALHSSFFEGIDRYYTPFISTSQEHCFARKELREIVPEKKCLKEVVPQLMSKNAEDFVWASREMENYGYGEVNLNLGCPSGTVTAKKKGAGFLAEPEALDRFFDGIFSKVTVRVSVKTRLGMEDPEEFFEILNIFNRYPIAELIVHPRTRNEFYKGQIHTDMYAYACEHSKIPLCFNGNIFSKDAIRETEKLFPSTESVMIGRGLLSNPALVRSIDGDALTLDELRNFDSALSQAYIEKFGMESNVLGRMKEIWRYQICMFDATDKQKKNLKKARYWSEFRLAVDQIFENARFDPNASFKPEMV